MLVLKDLLRLLAPRSLEANWILSTVESWEPEHEALRPRVKAANNWRSGVRAVDGRFYEIDTDDENKITAKYEDVRTGDAPHTSWCLERPGE